MSKRNLSLILIVAGVAVYFLPIIQQITNESGQLTGAVFAIGGLILWYLPGQSTGSKKK